MASVSLRIRNFGRNVSFTVGAVETPRDESELLRILRNHPARTIRVRGSLHSWSPLVETDHLLLDLRHFDEVEVEVDDEGETTARVGSGCTIQHLLDVLRRHGLTLPSIGAITRQTIAGAIATGTHGSGKPTLSHYVRELRLVTFDSATREPEILVIREGEELRAARCGLGCAGIVTEVRLDVVALYLVEHFLERADTLEGVLAGQKSWPLQQFALMPYEWRYVVFRRRTASTRSSFLARRFHALHSLLSIDIGLHALLVALLPLSRILGSRIIRDFYRRLLPRLLVTGIRVADDAPQILTMQHHLFRHVEMEIFIPETRLAEAIELVREVIAVCSGESAGPTGEIAARLSQIGMLDDLNRLRGRYVHHYPLFFRSVKTDDTLISMSSPRDDAGTWFTISLFSYRGVTGEFAEFAAFLARAITRLYRGRLHWGKYFPLRRDEIEELYPHLESFRRICRQLDPEGRFHNEFTKKILGLERDSADWASS